MCTQEKREDEKTLERKKYAIRLAKAKHVEKSLEVNFEVDQGRFKRVVNGGLKQS